MFIREKKNKSGSVSIQIISKANGTYKVLKTIGCGAERHKIELLKNQARNELEKLTKQPFLFETPDDELVMNAFASVKNSNVRTVGPELIFGSIYDYIGYGIIDEPLFRHLVVARLAFPLSKLKTTEYLMRYQGANYSVSKIYRFLDKLNNQLKIQIEQIAFQHTKKILGGKIHVAFYDMTTLYFEASNQDDLRKTGFSKDGKHSNPQIFIGLLVGLNGYAIGYDIYEGNTFEGHTLVPFLQNVQQKFNIEKPIIVADSGLLTKSNMFALENEEYEYILGARLKNETEEIQKKILDTDYSEVKFYEFEKIDVIKQDKNTTISRTRRLIVHHSEKRAKKDEYNRKKGLERLEKRVKSGKLTKSSINNRGYNKYLKMEGDVTVKVDYDKYNNDNVWDGLKGYITNSALSKQEILDSYKELWHIEKAFRMSKTDLRIRPIYHRLKGRIEAHICISFTAYTIYKELERILEIEKSSISLQKASEISRNIYQISYNLPQSKKLMTTLLQMDEEQEELYQIVEKYFRVSQ